MVGPDFGMAMGQDWIRWNGTSWEEIQGAIMIPAVNSVYMLASNDGWAVGDLGTAYHWNGTQWVLVMSSTMYQFASVFMTSATDGWAVGSPGTLIPQNYTTTVLHWNGAGWSYVGGPTSRALYSVYMVDSTDGWAVGELGTIIRWNGIQWVPEFPETISALFLVSLMLTIIVLTKHSQKAAKPHN